MSIYADSSFFVSLYIQDRHAAEVQRLLAKRTDMWLTPLHRAEWAHSVAQHVFHRKISADQAQRLYTEFERDRESRSWIEVSVPEMAFERCIQLAQQHVSRLLSRTLDTLHIASALELGAERFWTFDERQAKLAQAVGLKVT